MVSTGDYVEIDIPEMMNSNPGLLLKGQGATIKAKMFCRGIPSIDNSRDYPMVDHKGTPKF
jgi:hypothetical protein